MPVYAPTGSYQDGPARQPGPELLDRSIRSSAPPTATPNRASTRPSTWATRSTPRMPTPTTRAATSCTSTRRCSRSFRSARGWRTSAPKAWYFQQATCDSGAGATLGCFKGRTAGLGPVLGYIQPIGQREADLRIQVAVRAGHQEPPERRLRLAEDGLQVLMRDRRRRAMTKYPGLIRSRCAGRGASCWPSVAMRSRRRRPSRRRRTAAG